MNPDFIRGTVLWLLMAIVGYLLIPGLFEMDQVIGGLIALNLSTFLLVVIDKISASMKMRRIPEKVLFLATLLGGSVGMLVGMYAVRHKTRKTSFQFAVALLVLLQVVFVIFTIDSNGYF